MRRFLLLLVAALVAVAASQVWWTQRAVAQQALIGVVAPDGVDADDPRLAVWLDAIREQGLRSTVASVSSLVGEGVLQQPSPYAVLILPDQLMRQSDGYLLRYLTSFVQSGGLLLVCFDALTQSRTALTINSDLPPAALVGLHYARPDGQGSGDVGYSPVLGSEAIMRDLEVPPGKAELWPDSREGLLALTTYQYGFVTYPHHITSGDYSGRTLLKSLDGSVVLGERQVGRGTVLFANLPLGYLKGRTDGLLLHAVLRFLTNLAGLPTLESVPDGVGGLVFNWHVDANTALFALDEFDRRGLFAQGPFSIHLTTGPDTYFPGDHAGMDLEHNRMMQQWVHRFRQRGDALGNHGGWIHNYFGDHLSDQQDPQMVSLLERNDAVLSAVAGIPIREYSAPAGNQPQWVTDWIERRGVVGYYFTGNTGMAPTRSYRDGKLNARKIWSFPIMTLDNTASFEEASQKGISPLLMQRWLIALSDFAVNTSTVRTFYSHPPGWALYFDAIEAWFAHTAALGRTGRFRWYTMERIADFLNRREAVQWQVTQEQGQDVFSASHKASLKEMTWRLPQARYLRPQVDPAQATVRQAGHAWLVVAKDVGTLRFSAVRRTGEEAAP